MIKLQYYREKKGITQRELAKRSGLVASCVNKIEANPNINPSLKTMIALARGLNMDLDILVGMRETPLTERLLHNQIADLKNRLESITALCDLSPPQRGY